MTHLRVLDESLQTQDYCVQMDFQGAGVTVTRPFNNDYVVVTIPGAAAVAGWTDDGAIVRLTTITDNVSIGSLDIIAGEKLRVVNPAGVAIRVEGREWFVKVGVADAAATQAASYVERFTASMWTGAAEVERDFDMYAAPSSLVLDEGGGAYAVLAFDYEGARVLEVYPGGMILPLSAAPAAGVDSRIIRFAGQSSAGLRNVDVLNEADPGADTYRLRFNNHGGAQILALGMTAAGLRTFGFFGSETSQQSVADVADGVDVGPDNTLRADVRALKAALRAYGILGP